MNRRSFSLVGLASLFSGLFFKAGLAKVEEPKNDFLSRHRAGTWGRVAFFTLEPDCIIVVVENTCGMKITSHGGWCIVPEKYFNLVADYVREHRDEIYNSLEADFHGSVLYWEENWHDKICEEVKNKHNITSPQERRWINNSVSVFGDNPKLILEL